jgi:DNA-binding response OmpR family regulator
MNPHPLNILTVDDEPSVGHCLSFALGGSDHKVTSAFDGEEALAKIAAHSKPFDVVIIDNKMPRVSGLELVRRLRARDFDGKIIVLAAHLTEEIRRAYIELNVDMIFSKPFDVHELREVINLAKPAYRDVNWISSFVTCNPDSL